jgi:hypothetical protein
VGKVKAAKFLFVNIYPHTGAPSLLLPLRFDALLVQCQRCHLLHGAAYILENTPPPPPPGGISADVIGGKNMKNAKRKWGKCKRKRKKGGRKEKEKARKSKKKQEKARKSKKKQERGKKMRKGEVKG